MYTHTRTHARTHTYTYIHIHIQNKNNRYCIFIVCTDLYSFKFTSIILHVPIVVFLFKISSYLFIMYTVSMYYSTVSLLRPPEI